MATHDEFSDEQLTAYLDGEADADLVRAIEQGLETHAALAARLEALDVDMPALTRAFEGMAQMAPASPELPGLSGKPDVRTGHIPWWRGMAAAAVVGIFLGAGGTYLTQNQTAPGWHEAVAAYQALYVQETLSHLGRPEMEKAAELVRVSASIGKQIPLESLSGYEGLTYRRAQILSFNGEPLVQLAFLSDNGQPVALCILKKDGSAPLNADFIQGMQAASWQKGGYAYLLIGGDDAVLISDFAERMSEAL